MTTAALLLAAGESSRMGFPKPLLDWGGERLIAFQVRQLREAGVEQVVVVLGHEADRIRPVAAGAGGTVVLNERYREGRASSVRAGAEALPDTTGALVILNVDQPRPTAIIRALLTAHAEARAVITVPEYRGHRQHPIVLAGSLLPELRAVREESQGLRAVMDRHAGETLRLPCDDPRLALDVNTPSAYPEAHQLWFGRPPAATP